MKNNYLTVLAVVLIVTMIVQSIFLITKIPDIKSEPVIGKLVDTGIGTVSLCSNRPLVNFTTSCPARIQENIQITCHFNVTDPENNTINFSNNDGGYEGLMFMNGNDITIRTYGNAIGDYTHLLGNYTIGIFVNDNSLCTNSESIFAYDFEVYDYNEPPYLVQPLPERTIPTATTVMLYRLNDYFVDPEHQVLSYNFTGDASIVITVLSSSDVLAYSTSCVSKTYTFTAKDPFNLTATSNAASVTVDCNEGLIEGGDSPETTGGGGGGSSPASCISDWHCLPWTRCGEDGITTKTCRDSNACHPDYFVYTIEENCNYVPLPVCEESWECTGWSACTPENIQTRQCEDVNKCDNPEETPVNTMVCEYETTCTDGIQNQNETGVDCGGPCLPCRNIVTPGVIREEKTTVSTLLFMSILIILTLLIAYKYFHKQVNGAVVKVLLKITTKVPKIIIISEKDKDYLLQKIYSIKINHKNLNKQSMELAAICREYFSKALNISPTFDKSQLEEAIKQQKIKEPLSSIFISFYDKVNIIETGKEKVHQTDLMTILEEVKEILRQTSAFNRLDLKGEVNEMQIKKKDLLAVKIRKEIYNSYIAMHFDQIETVKSKYSTIINLYEKLNENDKGNFYNDLARLFNEIKYLSSINK